MAKPLTAESILTLPADLLKNVTDNLEPRDETALKLTCKRMSLLVAPPPPAHSLPDFLSTHPGDFAAPPPIDGRATPLPQAPMPWKEAKTLLKIEAENREVEDRDQVRGMDLSDTEDGYHDDAEDGRGARRKRLKPKKSILNWTANIDSAPTSPVGTASPGAASWAQSRPHSPVPPMPSFSVRTA